MKILARGKFRILIPHAEITKQLAEISVPLKLSFPFNGKFLIN